MAASLDDVVAELAKIQSTLEEIRDGSGGGGGSGDLPGGAGSGQAARAGSGGALMSLGSMNPLSMASKAMAGARMASNAMDSLGLTAGLRASNLGATGDEAFSRGRLSALESATSLPFAGFALANTKQELGIQGDAKAQVTAFTDAFARAGGSKDDLDPKMLDQILKREQEFSKNKYGMREMVENRAAVVGAGDVDRAYGKDATNLADLIEPLGSLDSNVQILTQVLRQMGATLGASAR